MALPHPLTTRLAPTPAWFAALLAQATPGSLRENQLREQEWPLRAFLADLDEQARSLSLVRFSDCPTCGQRPLTYITVLADPWEDFTAFETLTHISPEVEYRAIPCGHELREFTMTMLERPADAGEEYDRGE